MVHPVDAGMGSQPNIPHANAIVIACFITIAFYNVAELTILTHTFFKKHSGFYYYSLLAATWGIFIHALGQLFKYFRIVDSNVCNTVLAWSGWVLMVSGQSIVLYSRLHLVVHSPWIRWVLVMIICNGLILHSTTGVLTFLTNLEGNPGPWLRPYSITEKVQVMVFFLQEVILSSIYIWKTSNMLRSEGPIFDSNRNARGDGARKILLHTIGINAVIICLEVTLVALEFSGLYDIQTGYKSAVYSVKLKMEFTILNQLMNLVKGSLAHRTGSSPYTMSSGRPAANRNSLRSGTNKDLGHSASAYSRMEDAQEIPKGNTEIKLRDLKGRDVLKTTTTEIRFEDMADEDRVERGRRDAHALRRCDSTEVQMFEHDKA